MTTASPLQLLRRFVSAQDAELLASYFVVVPLREEAGISLGTDSLPKLFTCTLVGTILATPLTSAFLSRTNVSREASLRQFYSALGTAMLGFYLLYYISTVQAQATLKLFASVVYSVTGEAAGSGLADNVAPPPPPPPSPLASVQRGDLSLDGFQKAVRAAFYIFLNVQNLVAISAIWARCSDVFSAEAASRLFGFISAGATVGQLFGSLTTAATVRQAARGSGPVYGLIFLSGLLMYCAAFLSSKVQRPGGRKLAEAAELMRHTGGGGSSGAESASGDRGGGTHRKLMQLMQSFTLILRSQYLMLLCAYLMMTYVVGSLMYFQRSLVVATVVKDTNSRAAFFAAVHSTSALVIILLQMFATGRMLRLVGVTAALVSFPITCAALIAGIGAMPSTSAVALGEVVRKLLGYSLVRPAREVLFTVVSREEKYKAKLTIDSVIQRLGDTVAALVFEILDVQLHLGQAGVATAGVAACGLWTAWSVRLGMQQKALAAHLAHAQGGGASGAGGGAGGAGGGGGLAGAPAASYSGRRASGDGSSGGGIGLKVQKPLVEP